MSAASDLIVKVRAETGLSQAELARRAGIPRSVMNAYEKGNRQPSADKLDAILRAAGFRLRAQPILTPERNAKILELVTGFAAGLPYNPTEELEYPVFHRLIKK